MNWIVLYKDKLDQLKSKELHILVYAPEWEPEQYEIIRWDGMSWDCLSMQHESCSGTTLNDDDVVRFFKYYALIKPPKPFHEGPW